jgi:hypothetical protein
MIAKFGRVSSPRHATSPAANAARPELASISQSIAAAHAAAGRSLIGHINMYKTAGLVATRQAAMAPARAECTCRPMAYVSRTSSAPASGVTRNAARYPAIHSSTAMTIGTPGAVIGTSAGVPAGAGRYPKGANVRTASGQGASGASVTGMSSWRWRQSAA